jgi:hypothetical protein
MSTTDTSVEAPEAQPAAPAYQPLWKRWWFIPSIALIVGLLGWFIVQDQIDQSRADAIASREAAARSEAGATAINKLAGDTQYAITWQHPTIEGSTWDKATYRIPGKLVISNCRGVEGYIVVPQAPTPKTAAVVHVIVPGVNPQMPTADVAVKTPSDLYRLKLTLFDTDSGLRHCVVGDHRLFPSVDG